jgi:N-sulfoglucosamine sulfohydrolase
MKRRHALAATLALVLASLAALGHAAPAAKTPNILFILADNWRWPNAGVLGDPHAITPTFDRLAREGVLFTHVFNPVPPAPRRARAC